MMGRSLGVHLIIGIQRADAEFFKSGARDQFGAVLMLGNLSKEQKQMLVPDYRDQMNAVNQRGRGYLFLDGQGICRTPRCISYRMYRSKISTAGYRWTSHWHGRLFYVVSTMWSSTLPKAATPSRCRCRRRCLASPRLMTTRDCHFNWQREQLMLLPLFAPLILQFFVV